MKRILALSAVLAVLAVAASAAEITLDVKEHVLANGMKILMIPKAGVPRVVCHVYFKVGSINERPGITGSAHVHEHLMFKGTKVMGVTDADKDAALDREIDGLMDQIYRERFWKADGGDQGEARGAAEKSRRARRGREGLHRQGRPLDRIHEERRHGAQRLDQPGDHGVLRDPAVQPGRAADAPRKRPDDERRLPRILLREGRHHGGAPAQRKPAGLPLPGTGPGGFLCRVALSLGRHRLDGRPAEDDEDRPRRLPQPLLRPEQRRGDLRRRFRARGDRRPGRKIFRPHPQGPRPRAHPDGRAAPIQREAAHRRGPRADEPPDDVPHAGRRASRHGGARDPRQHPGLGRRRLPRRYGRAAAGRAASTRRSSATSSWPSTRRLPAAPNGTWGLSSSARPRASTRASSPRTWRWKSGPRSTRSRKRA